MRARVVKFSDEAAEMVARDELLALELDAGRGRGVVGLEPLLDGAALVGEAIYLVAFDGEGQYVVSKGGRGISRTGRRGWLGQKGAPC